MPTLSAGIILYRWRGEELEVLLIHPGGPFWQHRDEGAWMIPKGMVEAGEDSTSAAIREFEEEMGCPPAGTPAYLCRVRQSGGKSVDAFALEGDFDTEAIVSNSFPLEYPQGSGKISFYPEVDRALWLSLDEARQKMLASQVPILDALAERLGLKSG
jgi:predicted NUDIX family NTP pyrophosphohydrolase